MPAIQVTRLSSAELVDLLATPFAHDELAPATASVVVVDADDAAEPTPATLEALRTVPAVVIGTSTSGGRIAPESAALVDVTADDDAVLDEIVDTVRSNPLASTALALLLRGSEDRGVADGLVAESSTYSMLQGGPEFASWRSSRPRKPPADPPDTSPVRWWRDGTRVDIVLNRPHVHNAYNTAMRDALVDALSVADADATVTEVHLHGEGRSFCSGGDLDEFGTRADPASAHEIRLRRSAARLVHRLSARLTAHLHGASMGSGIEIPAFASRVVAAPDTVIGLPEVGLGLIPGAGGTVSLPRRIGRHRTALLALSGTRIDAATAKAWGLVDEISEG